MQAPRGQLSPYRPFAGGVPVLQVNVEQQQAAALSMLQGKLPGGDGGLVTGTLSQNPGRGGMLSPSVLALALPGSGAASVTPTSGE
jgi:hypothetical protein